MMDEMAEVDPAAPAWFTGLADPVYWSEAFFPGIRYGHPSSNVSESLNSWIRNAREKPLITMMETIRHKMMDWWTGRRQIAASLIKNQRPNSVLFMPEIERKLEEHKIKGRKLDSRRSGDYVFEVFTVGSDRTRIVDLEHRTCSCGEFQQRQYPCRHAAHAILKVAKDVKDFNHQCYTVQSYLDTYSTPIRPISPMEDWPGLPRSRQMQPPALRSDKAGRLRIERIRKGETTQRTVKCKNCG